MISCIVDPDVDCSDSLNVPCDHSGSADSIDGDGDVCVKCECSDSDTHNACHMFSVKACEVDSPQVKETQGELRQLQIEDVELACYVAYLERGDLLPDDHTAQKVVLGSK